MALASRNENKPVTSALGNRKNMNRHTRSIEMPSGSFETRNSNSIITEYERIWNATRTNNQ